MKQFLGCIALTLAVLLPMAACQWTDVIGNASVQSLELVLAALPESASIDEQRDMWRLEAPDRSARFLWSRDYSAGAEYAIMLEVDAQPFLAAGLQAQQLPEGMLRDGNIVIGVDLGGATRDRGEITPIASYEHILRVSPERIGHHAAMDHYNVDLGGGNQFEWASDPATNDLDIVFVLDPDILIDAGVDPLSVDGWQYSQVEVMEGMGRSEQVYKLLKSFDLI